MFSNSTNFVILCLLIVVISCKQVPKTILSDPIDFDNRLVFPDTTYKLTLTYFGMGCPCPQWATPEDIDLYMMQSSEIPMDSLFVTLSPANESVPNPFELETDTTTFVFKGRLSTNKYKWQGEDGRIWENRVFEYEEVHAAE